MEQIKSPEKSQKLKKLKAKLIKKIVEKKLVTNCPCGELIADCAYPHCGLGNEPLPEIQNKLCEDCPTPEDCERYTCQWGD